MIAPLSPVEKAYLLGVVLPSQSEKDARVSLAELGNLAESAGARVAGEALQFRKSLDAATYLGSGKAAQVGEAMRALGCGLAVVDDELKPTQQRNLEAILGRKVLDRTQLILDIFSQRARTKEGKLQVELAQLSYLLPRLAGWGAILSRQGGGIGTRGPGETKLESDRRRLRDRIAQLELEIASVSKTRSLQRGARRARRAAVAVLAGYTNAGKSCLFNALTCSKVLVQDRLFATLDPTIRPLRDSRPTGRQVLIADTVGFIRKLPHTLVAAFKATLEEVAQADLRLLVMDASEEGVDLENQRRTVDQVFNEIGVAQSQGEGRPWLVLNKIDLSASHRRKKLRREYPGAFQVSAISGEGLEGLRQALEAHFSGKLKRWKLSLPAAQAGLLAKYWKEIRVVSQQWKADRLQAEILAEGDLGDLKPFAREAE